MCVFVAARTDGEIVGTISSAAGHLRGLAVRPAWQGNGVASRLLEAAEADLRGLNCSRVTLGTTEVLQGAIQLYEGRGYRLRRGGFIRVLSPGKRADRAGLRISLE
jgi:GNAT superfamily N-acetyltransferase